MAKKPESSGPRRRLFDFLQSHHFWAFDATAELAVPVFTPLFGFSRISAPEIRLETEEFRDGTYLYPRHHAKGGSVGSVVFERGASMFDSDFYTWIIHAVHGNKDFERGGTLGKIAASVLSTGARTSPRRNLLIVQFARIDLGNIPVGGSDLGSIAAVGGGAILGAIAGASVGTGAAAAQAATFAGLFAGGLGPFRFANRLPARAWLLHECLPVRYRPASDFDAMSAEISLQELEVQPEYVEEFSLGLKP